MKKEEVYGHIDHTLLKAFSTTEQIEAIAEEALKYGTASICIPASFVNYMVTITWISAVSRPHFIMDFVSTHSEP